MKITTYEDRDAWMSARLGKITGSRAKDITLKRGEGKKIGFYELIAERMAIPRDSENPMDRGTRLEEEAIARFVTETGMKVDTSLTIWERDDNPNIAVSPDGMISTTQAVEVKCLSSARHIEVFLNQKMPSEYEYQILQYFVVNENLIDLYMVFYDPSIIAKDFFYLHFDRESLEEKIAESLEHQRRTMEEVNEIVTQLTF